MVVQKNGEIESSITLTIPLPLSSSIFAALVMGCLAKLINYFILLKEGLRLYPWCCHIELVEIGTAPKPDPGNTGVGTSI